jgi:hypothetical protein
LVRGGGQWDGWKRNEHRSGRDEAAGEKGLFGGRRCMWMGTIGMILEVMKKRFVRIEMYYGGGLRERRSG